jgi:hypothetical protein
VTFKIDSHSFLFDKPIAYHPGLMKEGELELYTNIILDKRHTLNVKSYKTTISIHRTSKEGVIQLVDTKTPKIIKRTRVNLNDLENPTYADNFKVFQFEKLNVY